MGVGGTDCYCHSGIPLAVPPTVVHTVPQGHGDSTPTIVRVSQTVLEPAPCGASVRVNCAFRGK